MSRASAFLKSCSKNQERSSTQTISSFQSLSRYLPLNGFIHMDRGRISLLCNFTLPKTTLSSLCLQYTSFNWSAFIHNSFTILFIGDYIPQQIAIRLYSLLSRLQ